MPNPTGEIVGVTPSAIAPGEPITLFITYNAFRPGIVAAWRTRIKGTLNGFHANNVNFHTYGKGDRISEPLYFNQPMPNHATKGTITLEEVAWWPAKDIALDSRSLTIHIPAEIIPITPKPPSKPGVTIPDIPFLPDMEGETLGIPNKYFLYAGIGCAIAALLYFFVFRKKGGKK